MVLSLQALLFIFSWDLNDSEVNKKCVFPQLNCYFNWLQWHTRETFAEPMKKLFL